MLVRILVIGLLCLVASAQSKVTNNGDTGRVGACGPPKYCARTDLTALGAYSTPPFSSASGAGAVSVDPIFGNRMARVTDGNTETNAGGGLTNTDYASIDGGWQNSWNSDGTMIALTDIGGSLLLYTFNSSTMATARVDPGQPNNSGSLAISTTAYDWSYSNPNKIYGIVNAQPTTLKSVAVDRAAHTAVATTIKNLNDADCLNGLLTQGAWLAPAAPGVSAGSGGSIAAGTYWVAVSQTDGVTESNVTTSGGTTSWSSVVVGANGTIIVTAPTKDNSATLWKIYAGTQAPNGHFQSSSAVFSGTQTLTSITTTGAIPQSCSLNLGGSTGCGQTQMNISRDETRFLVNAGGVQQDLKPISLVYDTVKGCRWFNAATGIISNGVGSTWTAPTGAASFSGAISSWTGFNIHGQAMAPAGLYGESVVSNGSGPQAHSGSILWQIDTLNIQYCYNPGNCGGHEGFGWNNYINEQGDVDGDDLRNRPFTTFNTEPSALIPVYPSPANTYRTSSHFAYTNAKSTAVYPAGYITYPAFFIYTGTATRTSNVVTTAMSGAFMIAGDTINVTGCADTSYNGGPFTLSTSGSAATYAQVATNASVTSGCTFTTNTFYLRAWTGEIDEIDPSTGTMYRFCQQFGKWHSGNPFTYDARGSVSQDGKYMLFTSDMMDGLGLDYLGVNTRTDVFICELR